MRSNVKARNVALAGALAAAAATAWAANGHYQSILVPAYAAPVEAPPPAVVPAAPQVAVDETLEPNETVVTTESAARPVVPEPRVVEATAPRPSITVETPRLTEDQRIQLQVMDRLAANPRLSGKIGVVSHGSVVTLTGWTRTAGQAWHAERDARSIVGVRYVQNQIRPRIGGSV